MVMDRVEWDIHELGCAVLIRVNGNLLADMGKLLKSHRQTGKMWA